MKKNRPTNIEKYLFDLQGYIVIKKALSKKEIFECNIYLEGASLTQATSRIIVETQDLKLLFEGTIDKDGNCKVPIKKFKGLLDENSKGNIIHTSKNKTVVIGDLKNYIVIDEKDKLLIYPKKKEQEIKNLLKRLNTKFTDS